MLVLAILIPTTVKLTEQRVELRREAASTCPEATEIPANYPWIKQSVICSGGVCKQAGQVLEVEIGKSLGVSFSTSEAVKKVKVRYRKKENGSWGSWYGGRGPEPVTNSLSFAAPTSVGEYQVLVAGYSDDCNWSCSSQRFYTGGSCGNPASGYCAYGNSNECSNPPFDLKVVAAKTNPSPSPEENAVCPAYDDQSEAIILEGRDGGGIDLLTLKAHDHYKDLKIKVEILVGGNWIEEKTIEVKTIGGNKCGDNKKDFEECYEQYIVDLNKCVDKVRLTVTGWSKDGNHVHICPEVASYCFETPILTPIPEPTGQEPTRTEPTGAEPTPTRVPRSPGVCDKLEISKTEWLMGEKIFGNVISPYEIRILECRANFGDRVSPTRTSWSTNIWEVVEYGCYEIECRVWPINGPPSAWGGDCSSRICVPTPTTLPSPTPTRWMAPTLTATPPVTRDCNQPCNSVYPCKTGLSCEYINGASHCRNLDCKEDTDCLCGTQPSPRPTATPGVFRNCDAACDAVNPCKPGLECMSINGASHCRDPNCKEKTNCTCSSIVPCNDVVNSGANTVDTKTVQMGVNRGTFIFDYISVNIPDRFEMFYEGRKIFDTGFISTSFGRETVNFGPGTAKTITVKVTGNSDPETYWWYKVRCPSASQSSLKISAMETVADCLACDTNGDRKVDEGDFLMMEKCASMPALSECKNVESKSGEETIKKLIACGNDCQGYVASVKTEECPILLNKDKDCPCLFGFQCKTGMKCEGSLLGGERRCQN